MERERRPFVFLRCSHPWKPSENISFTISFSFFFFHSDFSLVSPAARVQQTPGPLTGDLYTSPITHQLLLGRNDKYELLFLSFFYKAEWIYLEAVINHWLIINRENVLSQIFHVSVYPHPAMAIYFDVVELNGCIHGKQSGTPTQNTKKTFLFLSR